MGAAGAGDGAFSAVVASAGVVDDVFCDTGEAGGTGSDVRTFVASSASDGSSTLSVFDVSSRFLADILCSFG